MPIRLVPCAVLTLLLPAFCLAADRPESPLFPFVISYDAPDNAANVSRFLEKPAGKHGFVRAKDGRLATDAGPIRFWATNLCFEACFPSHEQAERLAARLARLGINCVRMHHMDNYSIWGGSPNKTIIDPKKIERLDYLIYQLKEHGIYTDLNLHVSRLLGEAEGFTARQGRPEYDKGLDNFEPRMIELQKKYARDLLTHVNPYTKNSYASEPAVALVEINNENALFAQWNWGQLDALPEPYAATFRKLWNQWLAKKYGGTESLRRAWNVGATPLGGEMLANGDFAQEPAAPWNLERDDQTEVAWSTADGGPDGRRLLRVVVTRMGRVAWRPQFGPAGFEVKKDTPYTLSCYLRADGPRKIGINCTMAHDPWERLGFSTSVTISPEWKLHRFTFVPERDDVNARLTFTSLAPGTYELAAVSLRPGGVAGLEPGQKLEDQSVPVQRRGDSNLTAPARRDFTDFLYDTEEAYWSGMYGLLKKELGVQALVSGTQLNYSPVHIQAGLDYLDAHSYFHHPTFPGRPWDAQDWYVQNVALVNTPGGTLAGLAVRRVAGMPYTVSEYNHPAPIAYAGEGLPMIAAFGAFQGWDGIFSFAYSHGADFEPRRVTSFFDIKGDPAKLAHSPACAALFLRGDASPAKQTLLAPLGRDAERKALHQTQNAWQLTAENFGLDGRLSLVYGMAVDLQRGAAKAPAPAAPELAKDAAVFVSDTGQLRWDVSRPGAGYFTANTPRTKLFTGFVGGRAFRLGEVSLAIGPTRLDWATVSAVCLDGAGFDKPGRILVTATGVVQNKDAVLEKLGDDRVTLRNRWGSEPVMCEGVPAELTLPVAADRATFYSLDEAGNRRGAIAVKNVQGKAVLVLDAKHRTVWYEVEIK
ncbi:MAG: carbohydrate binding domain-containing protein [Pirellulales bacterium]